MKIYITSVFVDDQDKALKFYTEVLGFVEKDNLPCGEFKWLTVVSPNDPDGVQLLLEPHDKPASKVFQKAVYDQGITITSFAVDNIQQETERLKALGVRIVMEPTEMGPTTIAAFDDTCGNLIQITQM